MTDGVKFEEKVKAPGVEPPDHRQAGIVIMPGMYALGLWFVSDQDNHDILACVHRMEGDEEGRWVLKIRLRTVRDPRPFTDKDEKAWWVVEVAGKSQQEMFEHVQQTMEGGAERIGLNAGDVQFQPIYEDMLEWFTRRRKNKTLPDWMHVKSEVLH